MFKIDPDTLYTRSDLAAMLEGSQVDVDFFTRRLQARKVFRFLWLGSDILEALRTASPLAEKEEAPLPAARNKGNRQGREDNEDHNNELAPLIQLMR